RPADQRFTSLTEMLAHAENVRRNSNAKVIANRNIHAAPVEGNESGLVLVGPNGVPVAPTNWSFGQLAQRAGAPAGYMRNLPAPIAADCINWGLRQRDVEELGVLLHKPQESAAQVSAITGPNYGRIWNENIIRQCVRQ